MPEYNEIYNMAIDTFRKILYPEQWIKLDLQLPKSELLTLLQVDRNGEIIMSQIADFINIPMSTATGLIERLVRKGYIERIRSEADRRIVAIRLTDEGKKLAGEVKESLREVIEKVFEALTEEEEQMLMGIFTKISGVLSGKHTDADSKKEGGMLRKIEIE